MAEQFEIAYCEYKEWNLLLRNSNLCDIVQIELNKEEKC